MEKGKKKNTKQKEQKPVVIEVVNTPELTTPEKPKELYTADQFPNRVRVIYTHLSRKEGEVEELEYGLAVVYQKLGKVKFI